MKQALHIFKKDVRFLQREIALVAVLAIVLGWTEVHSPSAMWAEALLGIAMTYVIARLIHAEPIPGTNQFWTTRPYRWQSLLAAKVLFILVFLIGPLLIARLTVVIWGGFPLGSSVAGLVWSQLVFLLAAAIPVAALASLTEGLVPFVFLALIALEIGLGSQQSIFFPSLGFTPVELPAGLEWIRTYVVAIVVAIMAPLILYVQYTRRRTSISRRIALGAGIAIILILWYLPASFALAIQTRLSPTVFDSASITISFNPGVSYEVDQPQVRGENAYVRLAVGISGLPPNIEATADALEGTIEWPDGKTLPVKVVDLHQSPIVLPRRSDPAANDVNAVFDWVSLMAPAAFEAEKYKPGTFHGSLYLTLFGNAQSKTIPLQTRPVNVASGIQCYTFSTDYLLCRSALRWPKRIVAADFGQGMLTVWKAISYSPFPSAIDVTTIEEHLAPRQSPPDPLKAGSAAPETATIQFKEPIAHFRKDFQLAAITLRMPMPLPVHIHTTTQPARPPNK